MKFLCVQCDEPMKLIKTSGPNDVGSLTVQYSCPQCSHSMAMLTNAFETQMVSSLGVTIGSGDVGEKKTSKCPFPEMIKDQGGPEDKKGNNCEWSEKALMRLKNIPEFVRPMAKKGIEQFAIEKGYKIINDQVMDEVKEKYGM